MTDSQSGFTQFQLDDALITAIEELGFEAPTPIQRQAIPVLQNGRDMIGGARTGSGKTAAFGLPLLQRVRDGGAVRALVLAPTRELAIQVSDALASFARNMRVNVLTIYGGASYQTQLKGLKRGCTVVVGTPGRVIDLMERGALDLGNVEYFVLDEADEMLRMGFVEDVEKVLAALPEKRQIALFSATMPEQIRRLAQAYLKDPVEIQVEESALSVSHIKQVIIPVSQRDKEASLLRLLAARPPGATLVFARTRARCAEVAEYLVAQGISADALHGDMNQGARERVLNRLRAHALDIVVATDVASRGIDVDHLSCVVNFDLPDDAEVYTHRIGRTARAGRDGTAFTLVSPRDRGKAKQIQRVLGIRIPEGRLPTNQEIADARRQELVAQIESDLESPGISELKVWLGKVLETKGWTAIDVAAAAVKRLGAELNFEFDAEPPPAAPDFSKINEAEIVVGAGRRDGVRPADIVGALANGVGMPASQIGKISLGASRAFVGLSAPVAEKLLREHTTLEVRGRAVPIELNTAAPTVRVEPRSPRPTRKQPSAPAGTRPATARPAAVAKPAAAVKPAAVAKPAPDAAAKPAAAVKPAAVAKPAAEVTTSDERPKHIKKTITSNQPYTKKRTPTKKRDKNKGAPGRHKKKKKPKK